MISKCILHKSASLADIRSEAVAITGERINVHYYTRQFDRLIENQRVYTK
jgi:hypothetical protein